MFDRHFQRRVKPRPTPRDQLLPPYLTEISELTRDKNIPALVNTECRKITIEETIQLASTRNQASRAGPTTSAVERREEEPLPEIPDVLPDPVTPMQDFDQGLDGDFEERPELLESNFLSKFKDREINQSVFYRRLRGQTLSYVDRLVKDNSGRRKSIMRRLDEELTPDDATFTQL